MAEAVAEASASPWPAASDVMRDVYSPAEAARP
jgi:TPP-dependent pyruvate/acetoin dehydrogenase alpha subunit